MLIKKATGYNVDVLTIVETKLQSSSSAAAGNSLSSVVVILE